LECGDKSPLSKTVPRHRTPKKWCSQGLVSAPELGKGGKGAAPEAQQRLGAGVGRDQRRSQMASRDLSANKVIVMSLLILCRVTRFFSSIPPPLSTFGEITPNDCVSGTAVPPLTTVGGAFSP